MPRPHHNHRMQWSLTVLCAGLALMLCGVVGGCEQRVISTKGIGTKGISTSQPHAPRKSLGELLLGRNKNTKTSRRTMRAWGSDEPKRRP